MPESRKTPRSLVAGALAIALLAAPATAQPATTRTPNVEGTWVTPGGTGFFAFLHRFSVGAPPAYSVDNIPMFHLSAGFFDWASVGALYATQTATVPGASQELELWAKERFWDEEAGAPLSVSLKEAFNLTAFSPDAELTLGKHFGPIGLLGAVRVMGNYQYAGSPLVTTNLGASWALTPYLSLAGDVGVSPMRLGTLAPTWGAGLQMAIPYSPHTMSLQVTNTGTDSIHGSSVPLNMVRYGFDFTIPFNNAQQWLDIFKPAVAQAPEPAPTPMQATPPPAAVSPGPSARPLHAPASAAPKPAADAQALAKAQATYTRSCAACHGAKGQGGFGPKLVGVAAKGDAFIAMRIQKGSPKGMPPFEAMLTPSEVQGLVAYVKGL